MNELQDDILDLLEEIPNGSATDTGIQKTLSYRREEEISIAEVMREMDDLIDQGIVEIRDRKSPYRRYRLID